MTWPLCLIHTETPTQIKKLVQMELRVNQPTIVIINTRSQLQILIEQEKPLEDILEFKYLCSILTLDDQDRPCNISKTETHVKLQTDVYHHQVMFIQVQCMVNPFYPPGMENQQKK